MIPDILHAILGAIKELPPNRWRCSVNGVSKGPVTEQKVGMKDTTAWARFGFKVDGAAHELLIERNISGTTTMTLDGAAMPDPHLDVYPTTWGLTMQLVVKCQFEVNGKVTEYRFDGRMWP